MFQWFIYVWWNCYKNIDCEVAIRISICVTDKCTWYALWVLRFKILTCVFIHNSLRFSRYRKSLINVSFENEFLGMMIFPVAIFICHFISSETRGCEITWREDSYCYVYIINVLLTTILSTIQIYHLLLGIFVVHNDTSFGLLW